MSKGFCFRTFIAAIIIVMLGTVLFGLICIQTTVAAETESTLAFDDGGLIEFSIASDPFSGGTHQGSVRNIVIGVVIEPDKFASNYTDYITVCWDSSAYQLEKTGGNDLSGYGIATYYVSFVGSNESIEEDLYANEYTRNGDTAALSIAFDIPTYKWNSWKYSQVSSIIVIYQFSLKAVESEQKELIYANYYHCETETYITGITVGSNGSMGVSWSTNKTYVPIRTSSDYIWD